MSDAPITPQFHDKAPRIMRELMHELSLSDEDAAAILGNFGVETGGFVYREEVGGSGGYGWAMWTGSRRDDLEEWCADHGEALYGSEADYDRACYRFFVHEVTETWEERVLTIGGEISGDYYPPLSQCETLEQKTISFMKLYERPGTPHEDWRIEMAEEALRLHRGEPEERAMPYPSVVISSGHGKYVRGASGILDEVEEARKVVEAVAEELARRGVDVTVFHDDKSESQNENLNTIVDFHNDQTRDLDISVHFNAYVETNNPMGTEVLYLTQSTLAGQMSAAIASAGQFLNRGGKKRSDLFFLNSTSAPAILLEVCFVDSTADANLYRQNFTAICDAIANVIGGEEELPEPEAPEVSEYEVTLKVRVSSAGLESVEMLHAEQIT